LVIAPISVPAKSRSYTMLVKHKYRFQSMDVFK
jgi:hypothetical protein